jgi:hypothetical protein
MTPYSPLVTDVCAGWMATNPAEATAEHKDRPDPQQPTGGDDAKPANGLPVKRPELVCGPCRPADLASRSPIAAKTAMTRRLLRS